MAKKRFWEFAQTQEYMIQGNVPHKGIEEKKQHYYSIPGLDEAVEEFVNTWNKPRMYEETFHRTSEKLKECDVKNLLDKLT